MARAELGHEMNQSALPPAHSLVTGLTGATPVGCHPTRPSSSWLPSHKALGSCLRAGSRSRRPRPRRLSRACKRRLARPIESCVCACVRARADAAAIRAAVPRLRHEPPPPPPSAKDSCRCIAARVHAGAGASLHRNSLRRQSAGRARGRRGVESAFALC